MAQEIETPSLEDLRTRTSEKWATYPPDVLPAWVAEMDFALASPIRSALVEAIERGDTGYPHPGPLFDRFVAFAQARFGWAIDPQRVFVVPDVMVGAAEILRIVTSPGDGIVVNPPVYPPFFSTIEEIGREVVEVPVGTDGDRWSLDLDGLERAFAAGARAYLLCNPHNPTGRVFSGSELSAAAELAARYDVFVVADEIHAPLTLTGAAHTPYVSLGETIAGHAVTLTGATKAWNFPGLKCGLAVCGSEEVRDRLADLAERFVDRTGHLGVIASIAAYRDSGEWLDSLLGRLDANRRLVGELLDAKLPEVRHIPAQAGYLAWLDCRALALGPDPSTVFMERGRVALSRGLDFGREGAGWARLNYGTSPELVEEAIDRMSATVRG